jgi:hypothetical protein
MRAYHQITVTRIAYAIDAQQRNWYLIKPNPSLTNAPLLFIFLAGRMASSLILEKNHGE